MRRPIYIKDTINEDGKIENGSDDGRPTDDAGCRE